jgi:osmotically-inducible protein OsmY
MSIGLACVAVGCRQEPPSSTVEIPIARPDAAKRQAQAGGAQARGAAPDAFVAARVKAELLKESEGRAIEIEVQSREGQVRLSGLAPSYSDIDRAVQVARGVEGVSAVTEDVAVKGR